ncbi:MAG: thioredoxin family protein [Bacteroidota bacterium]
MNLNAINECPFLLLYFSSPACNICRSTKPKVEEVVAKLGKVPFKEIDIHQYPQLSGQHMVFSAPAVIALSYGKELFRFVRIIHLDQLQDKIERYLDLMGDQVIR